MLDRKGQSLVLFVLIIPILVGIMALVLDVGKVLNTKNELDNITELVLEYGLKEENPVEEELLKLMNYNTKKEISEVVIQDEIIKIETKTYVEGIFSSLFGFDGFEVMSTYQGYWEKEKKIIQKVK